jgi:hypothetical protein
MGVPHMVALLTTFYGLSTVTMLLTTADMDQTTLILWAGGIPAIGITAAAALLAGRHVAGAVAALLAAFLFHALTGLPVGKELAPLAAAVSSGFAIVMASPVLIMAKTLGKRREQDAGDTMLLWGSVWALCAHLPYVAIFSAHSDQAAFWIALAGVAVSFFGAATGLKRAQNRRAFVRLALAGKLPGYRVRHQTSRLEISRLVPLYAMDSNREPAVLERVSVGAAGSAYRGGLVGVPVALVPASF